MVLSIPSALLAGLCFSLVALAGPTAQPKPKPKPKPTTCPLTSVPRYQFYCNSKGWVQQPFNLTSSTQKSVQDCARACQANKNCKSLKFVAGIDQCQLYSKFLTQMNTDVNNFQPGILNDKDCFTTDCNTIDACEATENKCETQSTLGEYAIDQQYACAYGFTAHLDSNFVDKLLHPGIKSACHAIQTCSLSRNLYQGVIGTLDIHYYIPKKRWVCRAFNDLHQYGEGLKFPSDSSAGHHRYTLRNSSVGAGYGFYISDYYT